MLSPGFIVHYVEQLKGYGGSSKIKCHHYLPFLTILYTTRLILSCPLIATVFFALLDVLLATISQILQALRYTPSTYLNLVVNFYANSTIKL